MLDSKKLLFALGEVRLMRTDARDFWKNGWLRKKGEWKRGNGKRGNEKGEGRLSLKRREGGVRGWEKRDCVGG